MHQNKLNTKSIARIAAIQTMYQYKNNEAANIDTSLMRIIDFYKDIEIKNDYELEKESKLKLKPSYNYLKELVKFTHENLDELDQIIAKYLTNNWTLESLPRLLFACLRVSICEIKYFPETPRAVIINEYTDIASDMLDEGEIGFVNSVLDKYSKE